jgi:predicted AlkP superfamily phosphohydrolase/phosphomutase
MNMDNARQRISISETIATGTIAGLLYFLACLVFMFPSEQLALMGGGFMKFNLFCYTAAFHIAAFTALTALLVLVTFPLVAAAGKRWAVILARMITYFALAGAFTTGFVVWIYYVNSAPLLPRYLMMGDIGNSIVLVALSSAAFAFGMGFVVTLGPESARRRFRRWRRIFTGALAASVAYLVLANLAAPLVTRGGADGGKGEEGAGGARRVVVLGLDAATWNAVIPFLKAGDLPTMKRMMETGSYGYLDTYGRQFTPMVWASMATGMTVEKHGVYHFGNLSDDWKAAPVWSIVSDAGLKAAVVNWVCTWPPFEVNGAFVSKIIAPQPDRTYFSPGFVYLKPAADSIISRWGYEVPLDDAARITYAEHEFSYLDLLDREVISRVEPDFVAYYSYSPDMVQHFFWKDMEPGMLRGPDWYGEHPEPHHAHIIRDAYIASDRLLAGLMERYGSDANYFVLSDHGMRPITRRMAEFAMDSLLEALGYVTMVAGEADHGVSTCYQMAGSPHFRFDIKINPSSYSAGREGAGAGGKEDFASVRDRIVSDLMSVRLEETGHTVFTRAEPSASPAPADEPDIVVYASEAIVDLSNRERHITAGGNDIALSDLLTPHPWSGKHRARGMFLAGGPAIENRFTGAWIVDDPYTYIFRYVYGVIPRAAGAAPLLRALHLIDEATTLDTAPTFLYLLGLPVAGDMDGRVLSEIINAGFRRDNPVDIVPTYGQGSVADVKDGGVDQEQLKERLKALGYIQ